MARFAFLVVLVLAAGCPRGGDGDDYPLGVGGGGGGTTTPGTDDAGTGDGGIDAPAATITGRVCLVTDLRRLINAAPGDCATMGANNFSVTLGASAPVTTNNDGSFTIPEQAGSNLSWRVTGGTLVTSVIPFSTSRLLPAILDAEYIDLLGVNSAVVQPGEGSVIARLVRNNQPVTGATSVINNGESQQTLYDGANATVWGTLGTGPFGVAWLPDNVAGTRTLIVSPQGGSPLSVPVTIVDQAITFVTIAVP
jgi:hypothetical protein